MSNGLTVVRLPLPHVGAFPTVGAVRASASGAAQEIHLRSWSRSPWCWWSCSSAGSLAAWATWSSFGGDDDGPNADSAVSEHQRRRCRRTPRSWRASTSRTSTGAAAVRNECTRLTVPLDYADPDGKTIKLEVLRVPAARRAQRVGQLVVDPGGPGGSAVDYATAGPTVFGNQLSRYFDIVGMDPRGVGESTPLECGDTKQTDEFVGVDPDPDTPAEVSEYDRVNREFGQLCLRAQR